MTTTRRGTEALRRVGFFLGVSVPRCVVITALSFGFAGCGPSEPLKISAIQVGRSLNSDDTVGNPTLTFKPNETIYAAALNDAAGAGTVSVRWIYAGQTVSEETKEASFTREGATAFRLQPPSAGFPAGEYRIEFTLDGQPAGSRDFQVAK